MSVATVRIRMVCYMRSVRGRSTRAGRQVANCMMASRSAPHSNANRICVAEGAAREYYSFITF